MRRPRIITNKPVAFDSPDHIQPHGTARDNYSNLFFNRKLALLDPARSLRVLDLGCSGGAFVKSILDQGGFAVGVEGSDYSKVRKRAEWASIPEYLFTADITEPFQVMESEPNEPEIPSLFNVITGWEFIEHIAPDKLTGVADNIQRHLARSGIVVLSVSPREEIVGGVRLHQTVESRDWWLEKWAAFGFEDVEHAIEYFDDDWIRGGSREYVLTPSEVRSFHLVLSRKGEESTLARRVNFLLNQRRFRFHPFVTGLRHRLGPRLPHQLKRIYWRVFDLEQWATQQTSSQNKADR